MNKKHITDLENTLKKNLQPCYILIGTENYLIQENIESLLFFLKKKGFYEKKTLIVKTKQDWERVILIYKDHELFFKKKIILITYKFLLNISHFIINLKKIYKQFNNNIILIMTLDQNLSFYYKKYTNDLLQLPMPIIFCYTYNRHQWISWVNYKIKKLNLTIENDVKKIIYRNYEGNFSELSNILNIFALSFYKKNITWCKIKNIIEHLAIFTPKNWINAIFNDDKHRSLYIINRFMMQQYNPIFLIRALQNDLIILINIKRNINIKNQFFFDKYKISQKRQKVFIHALKISNNKKLYQMIKIIMNIEIHIKKNINNTNLWTSLRNLSFVL